MKSGTVLCLLVTVTLVHVGYTRPQYGPPPTGDFPPMPPELERILPSEAVSKLKSIHGDRSLGFLEKQQKIDEVMTSLPGDILDKIPPPPGFKNLPENVQQQLKSINRSRDLNWQQKQEKLREIIHSLPPHLRSSLVPPPPPGGK
ncbi:unnamed protein product [Bursaphelenchus okinawaensis]|uniref:Uncharacterized protein n=1 Tax=Bursaphelenchus okinawaensis TaxID=465554 RepID=A0A811L6L9_9BILA|nr:unnamed protein product [Bursaphelenchus okinawaensis]CAG9119034.1 unnamed protein product [Bursaphelenchus okinawaensis]